MTIDGRNIPDIDITDLFEGESFSLFLSDLAVRARLTGYILSRGGCIAKEGQTSDHTVCEDIKENDLSCFIPSGDSLSAGDEIEIRGKKSALPALLTPAILYALTDPAYVLTNQPVEAIWQVCRHAIRFPKIWEKLSPLRFREAEDLMTEKPGLLLDHLSGNADGAADLSLYLEHGHQVPGGKWFNGVRPADLSLSGRIALTEDFLSQREDWLAKAPGAAERLEKYLTNDVEAICEDLYESNRNTGLTAYFDFLSEKESEWVRIDYSDGFYVCRLLRQYADKAISDGKNELTALLLEYQKVHFDAVFLEAEEADALDIAFGLKNESVVYYQVGRIVNFGSYPQSTAGKKDPIAWQVIKREEGRALLISCQALTARPFHERPKAVSWAESSLRKWLNTEFYRTAFSPEEREKIRPVRFEETAPDEQSNEGQKDPADCVFLLSTDEAETLLPVRTARQKNATPRAMEDGAWTDGEDRSWWWLRSAGRERNYAAFVYYGGGIARGGDGVERASHGVCPAIWVGRGDKNCE